MREGATGPPKFNFYGSKNTGLVEDIENEVIVDEGENHQSSQNKTSNTNTIGHEEIMMSQK